MRDYMKGLRAFSVTVTAGLEHTATTFTETFVASSQEGARQAAERKWIGSAIGAVIEDTHARGAMAVAR